MLKRLWWGLVLTALAFFLLPPPAVNANDEPWIYPVTITRDCYVTYHYYSSGFNGSNELHHTGLDIGCNANAPTDVPVMAVASGKVYLIQTNWQTYEGVDVFILHGVHNNTPDLSFYAHLKSVSVKEGDNVTQGQTIGIMGYTKGIQHHTHLGWANIWPNEFPTYEWHAVEHNGKGWLNPEDKISGIQPTSPNPTEPTPQQIVFIDAADNISMQHQIITKLWPIRYNLLGLSLAILLISFVLFVVSKDFRELTGTIGAISIVVLILGGLLYYNQQQYQSSSREAEIFSPDEVFTYTPPVVSNTPSLSAPAIPEGCKVSPSYPMNIRQWCSYIDKYADQYGIDPNLVAAIITQESGGDPHAGTLVQVIDGIEYHTSYPSGAVGLMQVMPKNGVSGNILNAQGQSLFADRPTIQEMYDNPELQIATGIAIFKAKLSYFGNPRDTLLGYGPVGIGYGYADIVLNIYKSHQ